MVRVEDRDAEDAERAVARLQVRRAVEVRVLLRVLDVEHLARRRRVADDARAERELDRVLHAAGERRDQLVARWRREEERVAVRVNEVARARHDLRDELVHVELAGEDLCDLEEAAGPLLLAERLLELLVVPLRDLRTRERVDHVRDDAREDLLVVVREELRESLPAEDDRALHRRVGVLHGDREHGEIPAPIRRELSTT